jgi:hypothetical protein
LIRRPSAPVQQARAIRRGAEQWVIATLLLLFGAAAVATFPVASSLELKEHASSTNQLQRQAEAPREVRGIVRTLVPKSAGGGKYLLPAQAAAIAEVAFSFTVPSVAARKSERSRPRSFDARAPPAAMA